jgi:hypothetical protein
MADVVESEKGGVLLRGPGAWWLEEPTHTAGEPRSDGPIPGEHWPALQTIEYISKLIILIILLLALPWVLSRLLTDPEHALKHPAAVAVPG